jgi:hypothetical protein
MRSNHEAGAEGNRRDASPRVAGRCASRGEITEEGVAQEPAERAEASLAGKADRRDLGRHSLRRLTRGRV